MVKINNDKSVSIVSLRQHKGWLHKKYFKIFMYLKNCNKNNQFK